MTIMDDKPSNLCQIVNDLHVPFLWSNYCRPSHLILLTLNALDVESLILDDINMQLTVFKMKFRTFSVFVITYFSFV